MSCRQRLRRVSSRCRRRFRPRASVLVMWCGIRSPRQSLTTSGMSESRRVGCRMYSRLHHLHTTHPGHRNADVIAGGRRAFEGRGVGFGGVLISRHTDRDACLVGRRIHYRRVARKLPRERGEMPLCLAGVDDAALAAPCCPVRPGGLTPTGGLCNPCDVQLRGQSHRPRGGIFRSHGVIALLHGGETPKRTAGPL
jgi:hypothetical protein